MKKAIEIKHTSLSDPKERCFKILDEKWSYFCCFYCHEIEDRGNHIFHFKIGENSPIVISDIEITELHAKPL